MREDKKSTAGGAAAHLGIGYQDRVAAWFCVRILVEIEASALWDWPARSTIDYIRCNTEQPVDDILLGASHGGKAFLNVKTTIDVGRAGNSALFSVLSQFVRQFIANHDQTASSQKESPHQGSLDRLVLTTGGTSSRKITNSLATLLGKVRTLSPDKGIERVANTATERDLLEKVKVHLRRAWLQTRGVEPTEQELLELLKLVRIQVLDMEPDGSHEREAKDCLCASVLQDPSQASAAWHLLTQTCHLWGEQRSGGTRQDLERLLVQGGIPVKAPPSFRGDIERLKEQSKLMLKLLRPLSVIDIGGTEIKIDRPARQALREAAEDGSLVVVGEPGAGKSGVLHDLVDGFLTDNRDVVFLAVDRLQAEGLSGLRQDLVLEHDVFTILSNWPSEKAGFLVVDALDAARSPASAQTLYDLLALTLRPTTRWRVIASVRQFDLRYNTQLHALFKGRPPSRFRSDEFWSLRHLNVPRLDIEEEWSQIRDQSTQLAHLFDSAATKLQDLLLVPFNVKLVAELLGQGISIEDLTPIRTQIELLTLYWKEKVTQPLDQRDARARLLTRAVKEMVDARSLRTSRSRVVTEVAESPVIKDILSENILSEWQPTPGGPVDETILTFAHHVLFDYAVVRLFLRGGDQPLVKLLEKERDLVIAIRPSLLMHFEQEYLQNLEVFWEEVFDVIRSETIPDIGKLIGPSTAVDMASKIEDFALLVHGLASSDASQQLCAEKAFRHVAGALTVKASTAEALVGTAALNWAALLEQCTEALRASTIYSSKPVLHMLCDRAAEMTQDQLRSTGVVSRRLLDFALGQSIRDSALVGSGLEIVCRTYESDIAASASLLQRCLRPERVRKHGHEELYRLGQEVERLVAIDPALVEDIYRVAFTNNDEGARPTDFGRSRIMQMSSDTSQDFKMGRWILAQKYPSFLQAAPINALGALIAAIDVYVEERRRSSFNSSWRESLNLPVEEPIARPFDFNGHTAHIKQDGSELWDASGVYADQEPLQMLGEFYRFLERSAEDREKQDLRLKLIDLISKENTTGVIWRRLLALAARYPNTLGLEVRALCWSEPILVGPATTYEVGVLLQAVFASLSAEDRERIERAILSIAQAPEGIDCRSAEETRNTLLDCLDSDHIVTPEVMDLVATTTLPRNKPFYAPPIIGGGAVDTDFLSWQGVATEEPANKRIISLKAPAEAFAGRFSNQSPTLVEAIGVIPHLRQLHAALGEALTEDADQRVIDIAWGSLVDGCESVARTDALDCDSDDGAFIKATLLEASQHSEPRPSESDGRFESWGGIRVRADAARGLVSFAAKSKCVEQDVFDAIDRLSQDIVPQVRFEIASRLTNVYYAAPELMWSVLERMSREETNRGVLAGLIHGSLDRLAAYHPDRISGLVSLIFDRGREGEGSDEVRKGCARILAGLYVWKDQAHCRQMVALIAGNPVAYALEAHQIVADLRDCLNLTLIDPSNPGDEEVRRRSFDLMQRVLDATMSQTRELQSKTSALVDLPWSEADQANMTALVRLADSICMQVYFASGAFSGAQIEDKVPRGDAERTRYLEYARPLMNTLSEFGYPALTHHLLQTLEYLLPFGPADVFLLIARVVRNGRKWGYQYESLAIDLIVRVVERFIAEFRKLLQEREDCRSALIEILDTFVDAGWPSARRLTYRLEEIYQ